MLPGLSSNRNTNLSSLIESMDHHGTIRLRPTHPNYGPGITAGRTVYRDCNGKGNTFLTCSAIARSYVFGELYNEIDISRSHITLTFGCWTLTGAPPPLSLRRFQTDQDGLETDIAQELSAARARLTADLDVCVRAGGGAPSAAQSRRISWSEAALSKCALACKRCFMTVRNRILFSFLVWAS
jgi:hypothetical protein